MALYSKPSALSETPAKVSSSGGIAWETADGAYFLSGDAEVGLATASATVTWNAVAPLAAGEVTIDAMSCGFPPHASDSAIVVSVNGRVAARFAFANTPALPLRVPITPGRHVVVTVCAVVHRTSRADPLVSAEFTLPRFTASAGMTVGDMYFALAGEAASVALDASESDADFEALCEPVGAADADDPSQVVGVTRRSFRTVYEAVRAGDFLTIAILLVVGALIALVAALTVAAN
jgi:hypothetical protein